jgi:hypothetical protein
MPVVVTDTATWVVVQAGVDGPIIGQTLVPAGVNRNVRVTVDPEQARDTLYVTLHDDVGEAYAFEYPGGPDVPRQQNREIVRVPFTLLPAGE